MNAFLKTGDFVAHNKFGKGVVEAVVGDGLEQEIIVIFGTGVGVKRLLHRWAPMVRIDDIYGPMPSDEEMEAARSGPPPECGPVLNLSEQNPASGKKARGLGKKSIALRQKLVEIVAEQQPMTVRQVYYQATVHRLVPKTEAGYGQIQYQLVEMRRDGTIPYHWISDNTRWMRKPKSYSNLADMLEQSANFYRRALWDSQADYVEVWCEKDALAGVISEETGLYDVPLMVSRGFSSESFIYSAAENIKAIGKPAFIYLVSDFDKAGLDLAAAIQRGLKRLAPDANITFERLAVNADQIGEWDLPTRAMKPRDLGRLEIAELGACCELDAIPPLKLRELVRNAIEQHIDRGALAAVELSQRAERETLDTFQRAWRASGYDPEILSVGLEEFIDEVAS